MSKNRAIAASGVYALAALTCAPVFAHTESTVAVDSNILVYDGNVLFAQGTGSLTRINLAAGTVLDRASPNDGFPYGGTLYRHAHGIVMADYGRVTLLDEETLHVAWSVEEAYDAAVGRTHLIIHDGNHTVTCVEIGAGEKVWSQTMKGGWRLRAAGDTGIVFTPPLYDEGHTLWAVDMPSGRELFTRRTDRGTLFVNAYLDGDRIHLLTGRQNGHLVDVVPQELIALSLAGEELATVDMQSDSVIWEYGYKTSRHGFFLNRRYFDAEGFVRDAYPHEPELWRAAWGKDDSISWTMPSGVLVLRSFKDATGDRGRLMTLERGHNRWSAYPSYLGEYDSILQQVESNGCLVVSSRSGYVECLNVATGKARWLYVFPVVRRTMSYSSHAMPPTLTQQVATYRRSLANLGATMGTLPIEPVPDLPSLVFSEYRNVANYPGRIVVDPAPDDPFADVFPHLVFRAIGFALAPMIALAFLAMILSRRRGADHLGFDSAGLTAKDYTILANAAVLLMVSPFAGLLFYARVDRAVTYSLWGVLALCFVAAIISGRKAKALRGTE